MELTNLKRIKNENLKSADLPRYWNGTPGGTPFETNMAMFGQPANTLTHATEANPNGADAAKGAGPWFALGAWAGGGIMLGLKAVRNQDELLNDAGTSMGNAGGIGYSRQNTVDLSLYMKEYDKGTAMSFLKNPFEGIARIFGRSNQKELIRKANQIAMNHNNFGESGAMTLRLLLEGAKNSLDPLSLIRGYQDGRGTENSGGWARVSNGEAIVRGNLVIGVIPGLPNFKDGVVAHIGNDGVISNHETIPGLRNSTYAAITNDVQGALALDKMWRKEHGKGYKNGKLPCFKEGYLGNLIPSGIGMLASIGQYVDAASLDIHRPNVKASNIYGQSALNDLAGLSINQYPIMNKLYGALATANNAVDLTGGLSGYQRSKLYSANLRNTLKSISDTLANAQAQNNQYRAALASAKMQLGEHEAQRAQQANIYSDEAFAKAHGAKQQGKQMAMYNFLNQLQNYYSNEFKRRQFNDTMSLYRLQQELDRNRFQHDLDVYADELKNKSRAYLPQSALNQYKDMLRYFYGLG